MLYMMDEKPMPVDCLYSFSNFANITLSHSATINECRFARLAGSALLIVSLLSFAVNIHCLTTNKRTQGLSRRDFGLVIGMFSSSLCVIIISVPSVVTQCFLCRPLCIPLICQIEGFNSFLHGCAAMFMLVALSLIRYGTTANSALSISSQRGLERHNVSPMIICFLISIIWAAVPLSGRASDYTPEGLGFHCGLNWFDRSLAGRIYFFLLFVGVFFLPIIIVIYINVHIHRTVYRLTHLKSFVLLGLYPVEGEMRMRRHISATLSDKENRRLRRLLEDRRFVLATAISVVIYMIAWTPYSIIALAQVFGNRLTLYNRWLMTSSAFIAKISIILNPIIYSIILQGHTANQTTR